MYLHIGNGASIKKSGIIGIFDLDTATVSGITRTFIAKNEKEGRVAYTDSDLPRSFLLCEEKDGGYSVKLSRISPAGLVSRTEGVESDTEN